MGSACYKGSDETSEVANDARITQILPPVGLQDDMRVKLLLLGAGDSGKSTLFKQMKINYVTENQNVYLIEEKDRIIQALFVSFLEFANAIQSQYGTFGNEDLDSAIEFLNDKDKRKALKPQLAGNMVSLIHDVWNLPIAKEIWERRSDFHLADNLAYFLDDVDRLASPSYVPTEDDFLRCRIQTTGVIEQSFNYRQVRILVVDVGGQRSERKKWIRCFDGVNAVLFVAAISEFDQKLYEDTLEDRMAEATSLFAKTLSFRVLSSTPFVLFLNKIDLFREKIARLRLKGANLDKYFPELKLGTNYENAEETIMEYMQYKFESIEGAKGRVFTHFTNATDRGAFKQVFTAASQVILSKSLDFHFQA